MFNREPILSVIFINYLVIATKRNQQFAKLKVAYMRRKNTKNERDERKSAKTIVLESFIQLLMMVQIYSQRILMSLRLTILYYFLKIDNQRSSKTWSVHLHEKN